MILRFNFIFSLSVLLAFTAAQAEDATNDFPTVDELPEIKELPNPFVFLDGTSVETRSDWERRRKEMKAMVLHYQFGHAPPAPAADNIKMETVSETPALNDQAVKRGVRRRFGRDNGESL